MIMSLVEALGVLLALIGAALWLRWRGVLQEAHSPTLSRLITDLMLPALIFASLSQHRLEWSQMPPALIMLVTTLIMLALAWWIGRAIRLEAPQLGAFTLVAGIGSSSTLGYTLIGQVFRGDPGAAFDAVMIGEIGAILPLFLVGVPIAIHFGKQDSSPGAHWREVRTFVRSPIFISMVGGFTVSFIDLPEWQVVDVMYRVLDILGGALPVFVALTIGLMLRPVLAEDGAGADRRGPRGETVRGAHACRRARHDRTRAAVGAQRAAHRGCDAVRYHRDHRRGAVRLRRGIRVDGRGRLVRGEPRVGADHRDADGVSSGNSGSVVLHSRRHRTNPVLLVP